jgi:hypothetical protein
MKVSRSLLKFLPIPDALEDAEDPTEWWRTHSPLFVQTACLGPADANTRRGVTGPSFQGFRIIRVANRTIDAIHYVTLHDLHANRFALDWERRARGQEACRGVTCASDQTCCLQPGTQADVICTDLSRDRTNCGDCNHPCEDGKHCVDRKCVEVPLEGLFFYRGPQGEGKFYTTDGEGRIERLGSDEKYHPGWTAMVSGNFGGNDNLEDLFFYDKEEGLGRFYATDGKGSLEPLSSNVGYTKGWDIIVSGNFGGSGFTDLFFYNRKRGEGKFYTTDGQGHITRLGSDEPFHSGWTIMVPGNFSGSGSTDLFFYDKEQGLGRFYATDGQGGLTRLSSTSGFTKGWDLVVPGHFGGKNGLTDLFFYKRKDGEGKFYTTDGKGRITRLGSDENFLTGWTAMVSGTFSGGAFTDLFFYDRVEGLGRFYATDGKGGLIRLSSTMGFTKEWDIIVPGYFARP